MAFVSVTSVLAHSSSRRGFFAENSTPFSVTTSTFGIIPSARPPARSHRSLGRLSLAAPHENPRILREPPTPRAAAEASGAGVPSVRSPPAAGSPPRSLASRVRSAVPPSEFRGHFCGLLVWGWGDRWHSGAGGAWASRESVPVVCECS